MVGYDHDDGIGGPSRVAGARHRKSLRQQIEDSLKNKSFDDLLSRMGKPKQRPKYNPHEGASGLHKKVQAKKRAKKIHESSGFRKLLDELK